MNYLAQVFKGLKDLTPLTISILVGMLFVAGLFSLLGKKFKFNTKVIVYGGLSISISFILSYIKLYRWPQGGSITPGSMLPLFVFSYIFGPIPGILAGSAFGLLKLVQGPYIVHPAQVLLDYIIAYAALGFSGFARENVGLGVILGGFGRFFSSFLSGVIFFASYAPEGMNPIVYSIAVNALVIGTDSLICLVLTFIPQVKMMIEELRKTANLKERSAT